MKRLTLLGFLLLVIPLSFAAVTTMCVTENGCTPGLPQTVCENIESDNPNFPIWYPPMVDESTYEQYCEEVCCDLDGVAQDMEKVACKTACELENTEECIDGPACNGEGSTICMDGESDCVCGGVEITSEEDPLAQWCCSGTPQELQECSSTPGEPTDTTGIPCGNGQLDEGEQCEEGNLGICQSTRGVTQECTANCRCLYSSNDYDISNPYCEPGETCSESSTCAEDSPAPFIEVSAIIAKPYADVTWGIDLLDSCEDSFDGIVVEFSSELGSQSVSLGDTSLENYTFRVEPETDYDVRVGAVYGTETSWSDTVQFTSGNEQCFSDQRSWCNEENSKERMFCDDDNFLDSENCEGKCYPTESTDGPGAACMDAVDCELCNGAYDVYGEVMGDKDQPVVFGENTIYIDCDDLDGYTVGDALMTFCYLDFTDSALKEYVDCSTKGYCLQYGSKETCEDDTCNVRGTCIWNETFNMCTAEEDEFQQCASEDEASCEAEGNGCFWQNSECKPSSEGICEDIGDEDSCTGGTDFSLNTNTNVEITISENDINHPKCRWVADRERCCKDSNDDKTCDDAVYAKDYINPVTTLIIPPASIEWGSDIEIPFTINEPGTTYAELVSGACGAITRPDEDSKDNVDQEENIIRFSDLTTGQYCLHYYSKDKANNLEYVNQQSITVNAEQLAITDISWHLEPWLAMNTTDVDVYINVSRFASCDITFSGDSGTINPKMTGAWGDKFHLLFKDLKDGQYSLKVDCETPIGAQANRTEVLNLDTDGRITLPMPALGTYGKDTVRYLGIHTITNDADCEYFDGSRKPLPTKQTRTIDGKTFTLHSVQAPELSSGFNEFAVVCTFSDGQELWGGPADMIAFAIDDTPPSTTITYIVDEEEFEASSTIEVPDSSGQAKIICEDESIPKRGQQWESGCKSVFIDRGQGYNEISLSEEGITTISVEDGEQLSIYSVDKLGNEERPRNYFVLENDISGPERPIFEVIS